MMKEFFCNMENNRKPCARLQQALQRAQDIFFQNNIPALEIFILVRFLFNDKLSRIYFIVLQTDREIPFHEKLLSLCNGVYFRRFGAGS